MINLIKWRELEKWEKRRELKKCGGPLIRSLIGEIVPQENDGQYNDDRLWLLKAVEYYCYHIERDWMWINYCYEHLPIRYIETAEGKRQYVELDQNVDSINDQ